MTKLYTIAAAFLLASSLHAQVHYSQNFETVDFSTWTNSDLDGDGKKFALVNASSVYPTAGFGTKTLISYSYQNTALTPNNLITSTPITLPAGTNNLFLKFQVASYDGDYGAEHYAIYLSPTNIPSEVLATTPVKEETLPFEGGLHEATVDVSAYAGQTVYLSFRHFNTVDMYYLLFDNVTVETLAQNNSKLVSSKIDKYILAGSQNDLKYTVKNAGANPITSVELNWNDGTDHIATVAANIAPGASAVITHPTKVSYTDIASKNFSLNITKVNNVADSDPTDNIGTASTSVASQIVAKKVLLEEGTGTWCGWCPRGMVGLDKVNQDYPDDQITIAIHNNDPMAVAAYNSGAAFSGFPGMNVDREMKNVDPGPDGIDGYVTARKNLPTPVKLTGEYSITGSELTATVNSKFFINNPNANYKMAVVVVEDGVKGTASSYNQRNYYSGGGEGPMGGYESKPDPVPASQMVYNHVGRALLGGYNGQAGSVPTSITDGSTASYTFNYTIPATSIADNMGAVLLLIDGNDGTIVNVAKLTKTNLAANDVTKTGANISIYPNPAKSEFNIKVAEDGKYAVSIYDMTGREIKNYGTRTSSFKTINLGVNLTPGKYLVNITKDGVSFTKELLIK
ncbi:T9SS type A sorting domain-containing protein [Kaistella palustris]|uniref:T9SS type A sorting domain-containing protein n=1 Tax=Kaistella palustris TaxID=493376 RepID=UPI0003F963DE|nr:Omp28-related outer membrane protein [Kaistella palustris]